MPFCRKCGRRLSQSSQSCPECKTSTTGPLIKIKKTPSVFEAKSIIHERQADVDISSNQSVFSFKDVIDKPTAAISPAVNILPIKPTVPIKPTSRSEEPKHEILKSNISIQEDIITNPQDYETQTFGFDLKCRYNHFWRAGKALPVSNGKAFCRKCGEPLRKASPTKRQQTQGQGYHFN